MGDNVPWCTLKWSLTIADARGPVDLSMAQSLYVFAAVELERVKSLDDVRRALGARDFWSALMDGARGLRPSDAPGEMTLTEIFERLAAVSVEWHTQRSKSQQRADAERALERLRGAS